MSCLVCYNFTMSLKAHLTQLIQQTPGEKAAKQIFEQGLKQDKLLRQDGTAKHFCVFFAGVDITRRQVFLGHHIKADCWLFNGGHIDRGELPLETVKREIFEEWGTEFGQFKIETQPVWLSLTQIKPTAYNRHNNCQLHYDLWYLVHLDQPDFTPDERLLKKEFFSWGWKSYTQAKQLFKNMPGSRAVIKLLQERSSINHL